MHMMAKKHYACALRFKSCFYQDIQFNDDSHNVNLGASSMLGLTAASVKSVATLVGDGCRRGVGEGESGCKAEETNPSLAFG